MTGKRSGYRWGLALLTAAATAAVGVAGSGVATADTTEVLYQDSPHAIDGSYIVTLTDENSANRLAADYDVTITATYGAALRGFAMRADATQAGELAGDSRVKRVEAVRTVTSAVSPTEAAHQGLDRIDQRDLPLDGADYQVPDSAGAGTNIYVIDSGVRTSHTEFGDRATSGPDFVDDDDEADDCAGSGTALAGVTAGETVGVAPRASVVAVRAVDCDGAGTTEDLVAAIDWVAQDGADGPSVAAIGIGAPTIGAVDDAVTGTVNSGMTVVAPAGNSAADACGFSPGGAEGAFTVGGTITDTDARADNSNFGPCLDLFAPATGITSASFEDDSSLMEYQGSGAAAAHATGAAALVLAEQPDSDPETVRDELTGNATPDVVKDPGEGSPNLLLYTGFLIP